MFGFYLMNIFLQLRAISATTTLAQLLHLDRSSYSAKVKPVSGVNYNETEMW